jgi:hypothetical protein
MQAAEKLRFEPRLGRARVSLVPLSPTKSAGRVALISLASGILRVPRPSRALRRAGTTNVCATASRRKQIKFCPQQRHPCQERKDGAPSVETEQAKTSPPRAGHPPNVHLVIPNRAESSVRNLLFPASESGRGTDWRSVPVGTHRHDGIGQTISS